jgi:hypothetical protein
MDVKLHVDLETLQLIQGPGQRGAVSSLRFKRGDSAKLQIVFLENGITPVTIGNPAALEIQIGIKPRNQFDRSYLAHSADWSMPSGGDDAPAYECALSFNTLQLNSALNVGSPTSEELPEITLMGEITWREGAGEPTSTRTFLVVVENDVNRGGEQPPAALTEDPSNGATLLSGNALPTTTGGTFALLSDIRDAATEPEAGKLAEWKSSATLAWVGMPWDGVVLEYGGVDPNGYRWWRSGTRTPDGGVGSLLFYSSNDRAWAFDGEPTGEAPYPLFLGTQRLFVVGEDGEPNEPWDSLDSRTPFMAGSWDNGIAFAEGGTLAGHPVPEGTAALVAGDDGRLTDARTPLSHKGSHARGGSDAIAPADIGAVATNPAGIAGASTVTNIVRITQAAYNALGTPDVNVTYLIIP